MEQLYIAMNAMLAAVPTEFHRYLYDQLSWEDRMCGIIGPKGVGKTTLMLQRILERCPRETSLYFSADHIYFANHTLLETAQRFMMAGGTHLFIDEVHKYDNWSRELKLIYDTCPDLRTCFTGSSMIEVSTGASELARRSPLYHLQGLSFREFLGFYHGIDCPAFTLDEILAHKASVEGVRHPLPLFEEYLRTGYYPYGRQPSFPILLAQSVNATLEDEIPRVRAMDWSTTDKLRKLMAAIAELAPFKPNFSNLATICQISRNRIAECLGLMAKAGLIALLRSDAAGLKAVDKVEKVYLDNTNLMAVLRPESANVGTMRETFFLNQMQQNHEVTAAKRADFTIADMVFEVGGASKGSSQLEGNPNGYVVKDGIERGHGHVVPLYLFGLTY